MISISAHVQSWLDEHPTLRNLLSEGLINHSALARSIKNDIEKQLGEKASIESITIALNRLGKTLQSSPAPNATTFIGDVSVQTGLTILIYHINDFDTLKLPDAQSLKQSYFVTTRGIWHASIITSSHIAESAALAEHAAEQQDNVTSITIKLKEGHIPVPGVCAGILSLLANKNINLQEVISTHNELTILTDQANTDRALQCLMQVKQSATSKAGSVL